MKKPKTVLAGIVCGAVCAAAVFGYTQSVRAEADAARAEALSRYGGEQIEVCVATRDIAPGEELGASNTEVKLWLADLLPQDAVRSVGEVSGRQVGSPVYAGEVVSLRRFSSEGGTIDVPAGLSALSVPAKDVQAVGGAVRPGIRVDVYATGASGTELLAEEVQVLATNAGDGEGQSAASIAWVTLAVDPASVQELISASQKMELYLVLPGSAGEGSAS